MKHPQEYDWLREESPVARGAELPASKRSVMPSPAPPLNKQNLQREITPDTSSAEKFAWRGISGVSAFVASLLVGVIMLARNQNAAKDIKHAIENVRKDARVAANLARFSDPNLKPAAREKYPMPAGERTCNISVESHTHGKTCVIYHPWDPKTEYVLTYDETRDGTGRVTVEKRVFHEFTSSGEPWNIWGMLRIENLEELPSELVGTIKLLRTPEEAPVEDQEFMQRSFSAFTQALHRAKGPIGMEH